MWIGTENGICLFCNGQFAELPQEIPGTAFAMAYDPQRDRLFISSSWNGFYAKQGKEWTHWRMPFGGHGQHDKQVRSVAVGPDGTIWLSTNAGLVSFSQAERRWVRYGSDFTEGVVLDGPDTVYVQASPPYVLRRLAGGDAESRRAAE